MRLAAAASVADRCAQPREQALVLREDDAPAIVLRDVDLPELAHGGAQFGVAEKKLEALDELPPVRVVEAGVTAAAVIDEYFGACVRENRRADREGLQREQRQTFIR